MIWLINSGPKFELIEFVGTGYVKEECRVLL